MLILIHNLVISIVTLSLNFLNSNSKIIQNVSLPVTPLLPPLPLIKIKIFSVSSLGATEMTDTNSDNVSLHTSSLSPSPSITSLNEENLNEYIEHHPLHSKLYGSNGFHICHLNCRSLLSKLDEIKGFLRNKNVHVLTLSETWLAPSISDEEVFIEGYIFFRQDRSFKINKKRKKSKRSGGIGIYVRNDISTDINNFAHLNTNNVNLESQWIQCKFEKMKNIIIGNFYRPPSGNKTFYINNLVELSNTLRNINNEIFCLGDANICLNESNNITRLLKDSLKLCNLKQVINEPTRLGVTKKSLLDHIYTNCNHIQSKGSGNINVSDHLLIFISRKKERVYTKKEFSYVRKIDNEKIPDFISEIKKIDWYPIYSLNNVDKMWESSLCHFNTCADKFFPIKKIRKNAKKEKWMTNDLLVEIKEKNYLLVKAKKTKDVNDIEAAHRKRNYVNNLIKKAKRNFYVTEFELNVKNTKNVWLLLKDLLPLDKKSDNCIRLNDQNGDPIDDTECADFVNKFFNTVGCDNPISPILSQGPLPKPLFDIQPVNTNDVLTLVKEINVKKSSAVDNIPSLLLKEIFIALPDLITNLINKCILKNVFPSSWKIATIVPLKKVKNCNNVNDLRPISILPLPSKLLEKIVHKQCISFLNKNQLLNAEQYGFQKSKSTISAVADFLDIIYSNIEKKQASLAIYIDFQKAFDRLDHSVLLHKLKFLGFTKNSLNFFENYLSNRYQTSLVNNIKSKPLKISHGIPQGSILGPLLFILYINDININIHNSQVKLFADDTVLFNSNSVFDNNLNEINDDLLKIISWCEVNNMKINIKKTKSMVLGSKNLTKKYQNVNICINDTILQQVKTFKYLGMMLDENLNFNSHINMLKKIVSHKIFLLNRYSKFLTTQTRLIIYKSYILPLIEYGDILYIKASNKNLDKIQKLQNHALKLCHNLDIRTSTNHIHKISNLNILSERRDQHLLNYLFDRSQMTKFIEKTKPGVQTRSITSKKLAVSNFKIKLAQKAISHHGSILWNNQVYSIKSIRSKMKYKNKLKSIYKNKLKEYIV